MGMDLIGTEKDQAGEERYFRWNVWGWSAVLQAAETHGWQPKGTTLPDDDGFPWSGGYGTNDGQVVCEEDADGLADALEVALAEGYWNGDEGMDKRVREFVDYCRAGAFHIY